MNPHKPAQTSLKAMLTSLWGNQQLIIPLIRREVLGRYRGSMFGILWSFFNPLFLLAVYTFCFSVVFKARWGSDPSAGHMDYAVVLFAGLIIHGIFAEAISRAPQLIVNHANFVKKIVFPLETLPCVAMGSAVFHASISLLVLLIAQLLLNGFIPWTIVFFPFVIVPFITMVLGFSWFLAAIGAYLKDISQLTSIVITVTLFLSPVFYALSALPEKMRMLAYLNPLTVIIEATRQVLLYGQQPNWPVLGLYTCVSLLVAWLGFAWFQKMRKGFADVI